jgi:hypothetical protein
MKDSDLQALHVLLDNVQRDISTVIATVGQLREDLQQGDELKPCPFCGSSDHLNSFNDGRWVRIGCTNHNKTVLGPPCDNKDMAVLAWNRRVSV